MIRVIRANYGRFSIAICNRHGYTDWSVNCAARGTTRTLRKRYYKFKYNGFFWENRVTQPYICFYAEEEVFLIKI